MKPVIRRSIVLVLSLVFNLTIVGCTPDGQREVFNADTKVSMIIYFRPETSAEEQKRFWDEVLAVPTGRTPTESTFPPGVIAVFRCQSPSGYGAICVQFAQGASRDALRSRAKAWPMVLTLLEEVAPGQVTAQDLEK